MENKKHIKSLRDFNKNLNISGVMNSKIKINEDVDKTKKIIEDSYNDYITIDNDREREIMLDILLELLVGLLGMQTQK